MKTFSLLLILFSLGSTNTSLGQTIKTQEESFQAAYKSSKSLVESKNYQFIANLIYDGSKRAKLEEALNTISIRSSKILGELTTFQKADRPYTFKGNMSSYGHFFDDEKQEVLIKIIKDGYHLDIEVKPNGKAFLTLSGKGNSELTYIGKLQK